MEDLIPSINLILPYTSPTFPAMCPTGPYSSCPETFIINSIDVMTTAGKIPGDERADLTPDLLGEWFARPPLPVTTAPT